MQKISAAWHLESYGKTVIEGACFRTQGHAGSWVDELL